VGLAARDGHPGDVLALCTPNSIEFVVTWYAASSIGAILTTVNPIASAEEILYQLRQSGARWLVTTADLFAPKLEAAALASGIVETSAIGADFQEMPGARPAERTGLPGYRTARDQGARGGHHRDSRRTGRRHRPGVHGTLPKHAFYSVLPRPPRLWASGARRRWRYHRPRRSG